ncbi:nucleotidyltransferase family protein [Candidatus Poribacteria bacterium]|nr:nucleotidyltransferase family protein [Candidatus Poribacteria bacterium]
MKTLVLASGEGTRMRPLTEYINKNMIPIDGKPVLEHIVEHLRNYGFVDIVMAVGVFKQQVMNYFGDGKRWNVNIEYSESAESQGTVGELARAKAYFENEEDFLVYYGDTLTATNLRKFYQYHKQHRGIITLNGIMGLPIETGIIECEERPVSPPSFPPYTGGFPLRKVTAYKEKISLEVITSIPVFFCANEILKSKNIQKGKDFSYDVIPEFVAKGAVFLYIEDANYHYDVGTLDRLRKVSETFKLGRVGIEKTIK